VPIGVITAVGPGQGPMGSTAVVKPYADPSRIDTVAVVTGPAARAPRAAVSPGSGR
jgi:rod shape-determining protein MreC